MAFCAFMLTTVVSLRRGKSFPVAPIRLAGLIVPFDVAVEKRPKHAVSASWS
jgi:hypothetical protein